MGRCGLFGVLAGVLVGIVTWCIIHFLSGVSPFEVPDLTLLGEIALFVTPIALVGLFAGLLTGMLLPRRSKAPPSLAPEEHLGLGFFAIFSALSIMALLCCCVATIAVSWNLPVASQDDWPRPLKAFLEDADRKQIKVEQIRVYTKDTGPDHYLWQAKDSAGVLALMTERWRLSPMDKSDEYIERFWLSMPSALCRSRDPNRVEYFAGLGGDGDSFLVMRDKARGLLVVSYWAVD
jgi:hypothetical protein